MIGYVYKISLPNGKVYIGSHKSAAFDENYWGSSTNSKYWEALFKYGKDKVKREVLSWHETEEDLLKEEYRQIQLYPDGYNTAHLRKTKEQCQQERLMRRIEVKRRLLAERLAKSKAYLLEKIHEIDAEMTRVAALSDEEVIKVDNYKTGLYRLGRHSWNYNKTKESDKKVEQYSKKNKAKIPWNKGKTFDELFTKERAESIKQKISINSHK